MCYYYGCMYACYIRTLTACVSKIGRVTRGHAVRPRVRVKLAEMQKTARL